ncbi:hypothetical protein L1283_005727 [Sphingobacterium sp. HSC-15S19]
MKPNLYKLEDAHGMSILHVKILKFHQTNLFN